MALNPPILTNGDPQMIPTEGRFVVNSVEVEGTFRIESTGQKFSGRGRCKLSHLRIIYINDKNDAKLSAFDLPLANIKDFKFNQPIFGANNLTGKCKPIGADIPSDIHFKLTFMHGGETQFVRTFYELHSRMQKKMREQARQPRAVPPEQLGQQAVMDPNEQGVIYLPVDANPSMMNTAPLNQPMPNQQSQVYYNTAPPNMTVQPGPNAQIPGPPSVQHPPPPPANASIPPPQANYQIPPQGNYQIPPPQGNYSTPLPQQGNYSIPPPPTCGNQGNQPPPPPVNYAPPPPGNYGYPPPPPPANAQAYPPAPNQYPPPPNSNYNIPGPPQKVQQPPAPAHYGQPNANIPQPDKSAAPMPGYAYRPPQQLK